jgi:hypothetical protein
MSDRDSASIIGEFRSALNDALKIAAPDSLLEIERVSREIGPGSEKKGQPILELNDSTIHDNLKGQGPRLSKWTLVFSLITVLRFIAERKGVDPDRVGTIEEWKIRHEAAVAELENVTAKQAQKAATSATPGLLVAAAGSVIAGQGSSAPEKLATAEAGGEGVGWWRAFSDAVPEWFESYLDLESAANLIRVYATRFVPELLQTPEYAYAAIAADLRECPDELIRRRVELRVRRQQLLRGPNPPTVWVLLDQAVLWHHVGSEEVMHAQFRHLIEASRSRRVNVQVVPSLNGGHAVGSPMTLLRFPEESRRDVVYLQQSDYGIYLDSPADGAHFNAAFGRLACNARSQKSSRAILRWLLEGK